MSGVDAHLDCSSGSSGNHGSRKATRKIAGGTHSWWPMSASSFASKDIQGARGGISLVPTAY